MRERVHYYSPNDLSVVLQVDRLERVLNSYESGREYSDLADVVELWHCKKFVDNVRLSCWDDAKYAQYQESAKTFVSDIIRFFQKLNASEFMTAFNALEYDYQHTVFELLDTVVKNFLTDEILEEILSDKSYMVREILKNHALVNKHSAFLTQYLKSYLKTAELLLSQFAQKHDRDDEKALYFPKNFTLEDKEKCISEYCEYKEANLNYIRLIAICKDSKDGLKLSDKTRLKAKRIAEKLNDELLTGDRCVRMSTKIGCSIEGDYDYDRPVFTESKNGEEGMELITHVDRNFLLACDVPSLIYSFQLYFEWFNHQGYSMLVSNPTNMSIFEIMGIQAQDAYPTSMTFQHFNQLAAIQLMATQKTLSEQGKSWEKTIKHFYETYLKESYGYPSPAITIPSEDADYVSKLRTLLPEMDAIVKQYDSYVENDTIDLELIAIGKPKSVTDSRSRLKKRNVYISAEENNPIRGICRLLFSDQSSIAFIKQFDDKHYTTFFDTARKEEVNYDLMLEHQQRYIDHLIEQGVLMLDENRIVRFINLDLLMIYMLLWKFQVISYWQCAPTMRQEIDKLIEKNWLETDNCLLSRQEQELFSYYLNNAKFTNGPAIRNIFEHGANTLYTEDRMQFLYAYVLMLFITLLYKIDLDLRLSNAVNEFSFALLPHSHQE